MSDSPLPSPIQDHTIPQAPPLPQVAPSMGMTGGTGEGVALDTARGYVGLGARFLACFIDCLILAIPNLIVSTITAGLGSIVLVWLYFAIMHASEKQATFGTRAMGIVITDMDGGRISFGKATGQYFASIISGMLLLVGYIMIAFTEKKQGLHDIMAGTLHYYRVP
jgi:uncharacterized RDD family membrane protein YckC